MNKLTTVISTAAFATACTYVAFAGMRPATGINGSFHDITYLGSDAGGAAFNQDDFQRVCIFCHTPHKSEWDRSHLGPLWNRQPSAVTLTPYEWVAPANLRIGMTADPLIGPSRLCMSCHDGIIAVDTHNAAGTDNNGASVMSTGISDLSVNHPIGFLYSDALTARGTDQLVDPFSGAYFIDKVIPATGAATYNTYFYTDRRIADALYNGYVTCCSCHEVHNNKNAINAPSVSDPEIIPNYVVRAREEGSALCLSCHIK